MKRIFIAVMVLVFNTFLFSCDKGSVAEDESFYETLATEGEDGEIDEDPDA
ncbi:hypothetical protein [uncultured Croceitalea sp.]|uniref:hypothetical protein n=1 Tax=uncultured Croceitalea sp. TaxID=1798908 RepID=UPI00374F81E7